jgi:hypothetical protein
MTRDLSLLLDTGHDHLKQSASRISYVVVWNIPPGSLLTFFTPLYNSLYSEQRFSKTNTISVAIFIIASQDLAPMMKLFTNCKVTITE